MIYRNIFISSLESAFNTPICVNPFTAPFETYDVQLILITGLLSDKFEVGVDIPYLWLRPDDAPNKSGFTDMLAEF